MSDTFCTNCRGQSTGGCELCNPSLHIATTRKPDYETELPDITKQAVIDIQQDQIALLKTKIELLEGALKNAEQRGIANRELFLQLQAQLDAVKALPEKLRTISGLISNPAVDRRIPIRRCNEMAHELDAILKQEKEPVL